MFAIVKAHGLRATYSCSRSNILSIFQSRRQYSLVVRASMCFVAHSFSRNSFLLIFVRHIYPARYARRLLSSFIFVRNHLFVGRLVYLHPIDLISIVFIHVEIIDIVAHHNSIYREQFIIILKCAAQRPSTRLD